MHPLLFSIISFLLISSALALNFQAQDTTLHTHDKRRGIGGGGRIGGGISGGGGGRARPPPTTLGGSNRGGRTSAGSGIRPAFNGYYAGGARVPYRSGLPIAGVTPFLLVGGGLGFWHGGAGAWGPYGAYVYQFNETITIQNAKGKNETVDLLCLCRRYVECSCSGNDGKAYVRALLDRYDGGNGDVVQVLVVNGSRTAVVNGTLANGTTAANVAGAGRRGLMENALWVIGALVLGSCLTLL